MVDQFNDLPGLGLLAHLRDIFQNKPVFQRRGKHIVFVCGGPTKTRKKSMRRKFLEWSKTNFTEILPLLAEDAYKPTDFYDPPTIIDLAEFETIMCDIADCIIVFPESAGSYAEVGYFAAKDGIGDRVLIANSLVHQSEDSFLSLGPIRKINRLSFLEPTVLLAKSCRDFSPLKKRLKKRLIDSTKRRRFNYKPYWELRYREKFLAAFQLISILQPVDLTGLITCFKNVFDGSKEQEVGHIVAILHAAGFVRSRTDYFVLTPGTQPLLEFEGVEIAKVRSSVLLYYRRRLPHVARLLRGT
jgi:hypothetical protein